jgi:hypothetical protein
VKASPIRPTPAASEASIPPIAAAAQRSSASSLPKGKEVSLAAAISPSLREEPVSISTFAFLDNGFPSSSPQLYVRLLAIECGLRRCFSFKMLTKYCLTSSSLLFIGHSNCHNHFERLRLPVLFPPSR